MRLNGKLGFICEVLGDDSQADLAEWFCRGSHVEFGDHPDCQERCTLFLFIVWMTSLSANRKRRKPTMDFMSEVSRWIDTTPEKYGADGPLGELINADDFDRVAWVRHAMNTLQWMRIPDAPGMFRLTDRDLDDLLAMEAIAPALASRDAFIGDVDWPFTR